MKLPEVRKDRPTRPSGPNPSAEVDCSAESGGESSPADSLALPAHVTQRRKAWMSTFPTSTASGRLQQYPRQPERRLWSCLCNWAWGRRHRRSPCVSQGQGATSFQPCSSNHLRKVHEGVYFTSSQTRLPLRRSWWRTRYKLQALRTSTWLFPARMAACSHLLLIHATFSARLRAAESCCWLPTYEDAQPDHATQRYDRTCWHICLNPLWAGDPKTLKSEGHPPNFFNVIGAGFAATHNPEKENFGHFVNVAHKVSSSSK